MSARRWLPATTRSKYSRRPDVGDVIGQDHRVWRITGVDDVPLLDDADRDYWISVGMPDLATWSQRPFRVRVVHVGGPIPMGAKPGKEFVMRVGPRQYVTWHVYPGGRWPQCSCCGDPMPCASQMQDEAVTAAQDRMAKMEARIPGCCWACEEPITHRQRAVTFPGTNLDLPTAPAPSFHLRRTCYGSAAEYEKRWLVTDESRRRILTYPECPGTLVVHHDGGSECHGGLDTCHGRGTHDHRAFAACYAQSHGCSRQCPIDGHPGCSPTRRARRDSEHLS